MTKFFASKEDQARAIKDLELGIKTLEFKMLHRFDEVGERLYRLEARFELFHTETNARFDKLEKRMDRLETRMDKIEMRMDRLEKRLESLEKLVRKALSKL